MDRTITFIAEDKKEKYQEVKDESNFDVSLPREQPENSVQKPEKSNQ